MNSLPGEKSGAQKEPFDSGSNTSSAPTSSEDYHEQQNVDYSLSGAKLHVLILGLGLAVFLMALDMSILVTAIPLITEKFQSTADIGWYMSAYSLSL